MNHILDMDIIKSYSPDRRLPLSKSQASTGFERFMSLVTLSLATLKLVYMLYMLLLGSNKTQYQFNTQNDRVFELTCILNVSSIGVQR